MSNRTEITPQTFDEELEAITSRLTMFTPREQRQIALMVKAVSAEMGGYRLEAALHWARFMLTGPRFALEYLHSLRARRAR
jgi:hypothetical protein